MLRIIMLKCNVFSLATFHILVFYLITAKFAAKSEYLLVTLLAGRFANVNLSMTLFISRINPYNGRQQFSSCSRWMAEVGQRTS